MALLCLLHTSQAYGGEVLNLGPLLYIEEDEETGKKSVDALGPFVSYKKSPDTTEYGFRPIFYNYRNERKDRTSFDFLYPFFTHRSFEGDTKFQVLVYLFYYRSDLRPSGFREYDYTLFPFLFGRKDEQPEKSYFALFPLFGTLKHRYGKDEISFMLFPLFLKTRQKGMTNYNFVWPFFGAYGGDGVSGGRFWPLYGIREKEDSFEDEFALWPFYTHREKDFYGERVTSTAFLPFYYGTDAPGRKQRTYLWPFINVINDSNKNVRRWDIPWPFVTISRGSVHTNRFWPLYSQRTEDKYRTGFFLWPMFGYKTYVFKDYISTKTTGALWLVKSTTYTPTNERGKSGKTVHLWPLFSYYKDTDGTSRFHFLSILETFLADNPPREHNWSSFWQLVVWQMDADGNQKSSILWNTIRTERTERLMKFELRPIIPVISFEKSDVRSKFYLVGGLLGFKSEAGRKTLSFLFVPIPVSSGGGDVSADEGAGGEIDLNFSDGYAGSGSGDVFRGYLFMPGEAGKDTGGDDKKQSAHKNGDGSDNEGGG